MGPSNQVKIWSSVTVLPENRRLSDCNDVSLHSSLFPFEMGLCLDEKFRHCIISWSIFNTMALRCVLSVRVHSPLFVFRVAGRNRCWLGWMCVSSWWSDGFVESNVPICLEFRIFRWTLELGGVCYWWSFLVCLHAEPRLLAASSRGWNNIPMLQQEDLLLLPLGGRVDV